jgi:hypothetical protein
MVISRLVKGSSIRENVVVVLGRQEEAVSGGVKSK